MYDGSVNEVSTRLSTTNASLNALKEQFTALTSENVDVYASQGMKNLFGDTVKVMEMQSEAGASRFRYEGLYNYLLGE